MNLFARKRILAGAVALGFVLLGAIAPQPARAANTLGKNFEFGVFVAEHRYQVSSTPIAVPGGHAFRVQGWVLDSRTMKPGATLLVATDGGIPIPVRAYPLRRPDVATALKDPDAIKSGFELTVAKGLSAGVHRLHFTLVGKDGSVMSLNTDVLVAIGNP